MKRSLSALARSKTKRGPIVQTTEGPVMGKRKAKGRIHQFAGIPYAAAPVGELRWRAPQDAAKHDDLLSCTKHGPMAHQRAQIIDEFYATMVSGIGISKAKQKTLSALLKAVPKNENEDCLTLGIRTPAEATNLPVMVWIHGGDHTDGASNEILYESSVLPERGCVLVSINYRLGLMGFFAHPDLDSESEDGVSGNYGLLDQIKALEWIRDNIAAFGGDPGRVTIFGESAGGESVLNLMTAPKARGLFHAAIAQSPSDCGRWLHLRKPMLNFMPAQDAGVQFAASVVGDEEGQVARMRAQPAEELYEQYRADLDSGRHFYPVVDGKILPTTPMTAFSEGTQAPVPLMIGYNADEGTLFASLTHPAGAEMAPVTPTQYSSEEVREALAMSYGSDELAEQVLALYPGLDDGDTQAMLDHCRDHMFGVHVDHASRRHAAAGHPVYRYYFQALPASPTQTVGAFHVAEVLYVFDTSMPMIPTAPDAHLLVREMGDRWFAFAATHTPDSPGRDAWPTYDPADPKHLVLDRPTSSVQACHPQPGLDLMRGRIEYLNGVSQTNATIDVRDGQTAEGLPSTQA